MADINPPIGGTDEADPKKPWKALVPVVVGILYAVIEAVQIQLGTGEWDNDDWIAVALALVSAIGVYLTRNPKVSERRANGL